MKPTKSRMSRREFLRLTGAVTATSLLTSCVTVVTPQPAQEAAAPTEAPAEPTEAPAAAQPTLRVWMENAFLPEIDQWNEQTFKEWGAQNNTEVEFVAAAIGPYRERLAASVGTDAVPAIAQNFVSLLAQWQGRDQLVPVTDLVNKLNEQGGGFLPVALSIPAIEGEYWGVPWGIDPVIMHARQDLLDAAGLPYPTTWDEFRETCQELQQANPGVFGWAMPMGNDADTDNSFLPILWSFGGSYANEDGSLAFKSDAMLQAVELVQTMYKEDQIIPPGAVGWDGGGNNQAYQARQAVFAYNSGSIYAWTAANDEELQQATRLYGPPAGPAGSFSTTAGWGLSIFKGPHDVEAAQSALEYYFEPARYAELIGIGKGRLSPVYRELLSSDIFVENEAYSQIPEMVENGRLASYAGPMTAAIGELLETWVVPEMLQNVMVNDMAPEQAMDAAYERAQQIWEKHGLS
jgi:multiple sugar transport system substrate-binding protein